MLRVICQNTQSVIAEVCWQKTWQHSWRSPTSLAVWCAPLPLQAKSEVRATGTDSRRKARGRQWKAIQNYIHSPGNNSPGSACAKLMRKARKGIEQRNIGTGKQPNSRKVSYTYSKLCAKLTMRQANYTNSKIVV